VDAAAVLRGLGFDACQRVDVLPAAWHGDLHMHVRDERGASFSVRAVRLGRARRYEDAEPCTARSVCRQIEVARVFRAAGLPFMQLARGPIEMEGFVVVAFAWADARPRVTPDIETARAVGALLRAFHDVGRRVDASGLPRHDVAAMARRSLVELADVAPAAFLRRAEEVVTRLHARVPRPIVTHGDLNLPNVLFEPPCVVDFDQIGAQDPYEELAWVIKWWSRRDGVGDNKHEPALARAVLDGYDERIESGALAPILWASGCLNANGAAKLVRARDRRLVAERLLVRADTLADVLA
jgi:hypothetical protein